MGEEFQASQDVAAPQINVASGVALGITLLRHVPAKPGEGVRAAARELRAATQRVQVDAASGVGFLSEVEFAHAAYGAALGITAKHDAAEDNVAVAESLRALAAAVAEYGLQLGAQYRGASEETRKAIRAGLRPIDEHRARYARGGGEASAEEGEAPVSRVTPVPEAG